MDRDDLIAHLRFARENMCLNCTYDDILDQAIEMIKAQEPMKPTWRRGYAYCAKCGFKLHWIVDKNNYCPNCGKAVKWDG